MPISDLGGTNKVLMQKGWLSTGEVSDIACVEFADHSDTNRACHSDILTALDIDIIVKAMAAPTQSSITEAYILAALRDVYDPELRANIVELGLVHSISLEHDHEAPGTGIPGVPPRLRVHIGLTPPYPGSEMEAQVIAVIQNRLAAFPGISRTQVEVLAEPRWTPERISPELRERLSLAIASNQRSHALVQIQTVPAKQREES